MSDWQDAAFSNRHVHNRGSKRNKTASGSDVDISKLFGTYEINCPSATKLGSRSGEHSKTGRGTRDGSLEIYCLNDDGNALTAEMVFPGVLHASSVILAGSRKVMKEVVKGLEEEDEGSGLENEDTAHDGTDDIKERKHNETVEDVDAENSVEEAGDEDEDDDDEIDKALPGDSFELDPAASRRGRGDAFEKNSFRSTKFWVKWQGEILAESIIDIETPGEGLVDGVGYWVWSGSKSNNFSGTLSCRALNWDNVKIEGRMLRPALCRDYTLRWQRSESPGQES